ncbi:hypothetical protein GLA29479_33 [Lysobacter antibioticus]|uniref:Uncharacterized protein n=1 Tax=Lysobacter antibioticus TaxID=84531 RepID=A0A0S2FCI5_LYSAN|nr:hypothetical protein GLA29479_33 [Lysobacter antibioticus]ALN81282.1 hypothetical protein LA76x_3154 [Lysobacter antibioticus]
MQGAGGRGGHGQQSDEREAGLGHGTIPVEWCRHYSERPRPAPSQKSCSHRTPLAFRRSAQVAMQRPRSERLHPIPSRCTAQGFARARRLGPNPTRHPDTSASVTTVVRRIATPSSRVRDPGLRTAKTAASRIIESVIRLKSRHIAP